MLDYYATPNVREICHGVKKGELAAILKMAETLSLGISENDIITPVPNRNGEPGVMLRVCKHISVLTGCKVWDGMRGNARASQYESKKKGVSLGRDDLGFKLTDVPPIPSGRHFVVDTIKDTGTTLNAALELLGRAEQLSFAAVDKDVELQAQMLREGITKDDPDALLKALVGIDREDVAFAFVYQSVTKLPAIDGMLSAQLKKQFKNPIHAGLNLGIEKGFVSAFDITAPKREVDSPVTAPTASVNSEEPKSLSLKR
jgi:hypothetical protein